MLAPKTTPGMPSACRSAVNARTCPHAILNADILKARLCPDQTFEQFNLLCWLLEGREEASTFKRNQPGESMFATFSATLILISVAYHYLPLLLTIQCSWRAGAVVTHPDAQTEGDPQVRRTEARVSMQQTPLFIGMNVDGA